MSQTVKRIVLLLLLFAVAYGEHMLWHYTVPLWARFPLVLVCDTALLTGYWFLIKPQNLIGECTVVGGVLIGMALALSFIKAHWFHYTLSYKTVYVCAVAGCAPYIAGYFYTLFKRRPVATAPAVH